MVDGMYVKDPVLGTLGTRINNDAIEGISDVIEESEEWVIRRNGSGAQLKWWKHKSGTPEHIGFDMTSREVWERDYRPLILKDDPARVDVKGAAESLAEDGVAQQLSDRAGQRGDVIYGNQESRLAVHNGLPAAADLRGDLRQTAGGTFHQHTREPFAVRGQHVHVHAVVEFRQVVAVLQAGEFPALLGGQVEIGRIQTSVSRGRGKAGPSSIARAPSQCQRGSYQEGRHNADSNRCLFHFLSPLFRDFANPGFTPVNERSLIFRNTYFGTILIDRGCPPKGVKDQQRRGEVLRMISGESRIE
jgi:hypothetical protein